MTNNLKDNCKKPILLCILDGWGIGDESPKNNHNAIALAKIPNYQDILNKFPHCQLATSGLDVGLPEGQMGNSEVGHTCIGAGRIIFQDLPRINNAIIDGSLAENQHLKNLISACKKNNNVCHLLGLLSDGGVHSHIDHIIFLAQNLAQNDIEVKLHCFLDGRDVAQKSAKFYLQFLLDKIKPYPQIKIASIAGRYYAMDRDNNWDRTNLAFEAIINGTNSGSKQFIDPLLAIDDCYQKQITDEFILPITAQNYSGVKDGDGLLVANFRADRIRQICNALIEQNINQNLPKDKKINFCHRVSARQYSKQLDKNFVALFPNIKIKNSLGEIFSNLGLKQLRIAETEKYAHVTFFFSGGRELEFKGENRILIKSPAIATYDLLPEMAAIVVGENLSSAIKKDDYDFIVVNYANPDMVGHSGVLSASIKACQIIDDQLGILRDLILQKDGKMIICADHGNVEEMVDENGNPHTSHTTNPVPFILIGNNLQNIQLKDGRLCDVAPTILSLIGISKPKEMTGENLLIKI